MTRRVAAFVAAAVLASLAIAGPVSAQEDPITWWALGDSYSSGEGIPGTERPAAGQPECARASGRNTDAKAWAVVARETLAEQRVSSWAFTPCTGAISSDVAGQMTEAAAASESDRADIVTLSMGGNDIFFADVVKGCLDLQASWKSLVPGCDVDEPTMRRRIDMLTGASAPVAGQYRGVTLPKLFDQIAEKVNAGGAVIVLGYPQVVEEWRRWDRWRRDIIGNCEGVQSYDVDMLRSVAGYLNQQIALTVQAANQRWSGKGVRFHWQDLATGVYETGDDATQRHALCSRAPWLNGQTTGVWSGDWRFERSFHPHQVGHTETGRWLGNWMRSDLGIDRIGRPPEPTDSLSVDELVVSFVEAVIAGEDVTDLATPEAIAEAEAMANRPDDPMVRGPGFTAELGDDYTQYSNSSEGVCGLVGDVTGECLVVARHPDGSFAGLFRVTYLPFSLEDDVEYVDGVFLRDGKPVEPDTSRPQVIGISDIRG